MGKKKFFFFLLVMRTLRVCSLNNFPVPCTAVVTVVAMLYITSQDLLIL